MERCCHQWMLKAKPFAPDRQNFPRHRFGFGWLVFVAEKNTQDTEGICSLQTFVSKQFSLDRERFPGQRFRLRGSSVMPIDVGQIIERNGHIRILVAEETPPNG